MRNPNNLRRKVASRAPRRKLFIFSEGKNTEPQYLKAYERVVSSTSIEIVYGSKNGTPEALLRQAADRKDEIGHRAYKKENGDRDEVWVIFDRDEHPNVDKVLKECRRMNILYAFSNPCFELWLILHFTDYDADEHHHATQEKCEKVCPGYTKDSRKIPDLAALMPTLRRRKCEPISSSSGESAMGERLH